MGVLIIQQTAKPMTPAPVAVSASDTVAADPVANLILVVRNAGGSPDTVTITDPGVTASGSPATNPTFSVPATTGERWYLLQPQLQNASGIITIGHSFTTSVTCFVVRND